MTLLARWVVDPSALGSGAALHQLFAQPSDSALAASAELSVHWLELAELRLREEQLAAVLVRKAENYCTSGRDHEF